MKILKNRDELARRLLENAEARVVFTNGVFDLLHGGHIELLWFARRQGDVLVVGVNDDESVRRLKGPSRPVFPLEERMEILAALKPVTWVVPFSEDTPLELIRSMPRLDVLVKGGDYSAREVVGRREVEARGGRLLLCPIRTENSTSRILSKLGRA
ncbi:MAG: adenylyltransferase/cytidyltransferase family protein [Candidatus Aminicenantes bacterium]|nr:adenylyltransferase/cytidyltransferase family protein [Candidatus Aminicenantes bacterium]